MDLLRNSMDLIRIVMDLINITLISIISFFYGRLLKSTVNWLNVDGFKIINSDLKMELFCVGSWFWAFMNLQPMEGTIFALISGILFAISWIDFHTFQIPFLLIIVSELPLFLEFYTERSILRVLFMV